MKKVLFLQALSLCLSICSFSQNAVNLPNFYLSSHLGIMPDDDNHASFDISVGSQFNKWIGVGLSYGAFTEIDAEPESFSGISLQYRAVPGKRFVWTAGVGFVVKYRMASHERVHRAIISSGNTFYQVHAGWRLGKNFTVGLSIFSLPEMIVETQFIGLDASGNEVLFEPRPVKMIMEAPQLTIGVNFN